MATLEQKIQEMLAAKSAKKSLTEGVTSLGFDLAQAASANLQKTGLPVGNPLPGDQQPVPQGSSQIPPEQELDDNDPSETATQTAPTAIPPIPKGDANAALNPGQVPGPGMDMESQRLANLAANEQAKQQVEEDVKQIFAGQELSEDIRTKATALYEAAVHARVQHIASSKLAELQEQNTRELESQKEVLVEQVAAYLNFAVKDWAKSNAVGIKAGLRSEITEAFMEGMKNLFQESMLDVPDDETNVVEKLVEANEALKTQINEGYEKILEAKKEADAEKKVLKEKVESLEKQAILESASKSLSALEAEKLKTLVEGMEFTSKELFTEKVALVKATHFAGTQKVSGSKQSLTESVSNQSAKADGAISAYVQAIKNTTR